MTNKYYDILVEDMMFFASITLGPFCQMEHIPLDLLDGNQLLPMNSASGNGGTVLPFQPLCVLQTVQHRD